MLSVCILCISVVRQCDWVHQVVAGVLLEAGPQTEVVEVVNVRGVVYALAAVPHLSVRVHMIPVQYTQC